ncbi:MAG: hypothetical protein Q9199_001895 [Rusavskia elegans]
MCLRTIRDDSSTSTDRPPLGERKEPDEFLQMVEEVNLCAKYCVVLLKDFLKLSWDTSEKPASEVLCQEFQRLHDAMYGYKCLFFKPILDNALKWIGFTKDADEKLVLKDAAGFLSKSIDDLEDQIRQLRESGKASITSNPPPKMPLRHPWSDRIDPVTSALGITQLKGELPHYFETTQSLKANPLMSSDRYKFGMPQTTFGAIHWIDSIDQPSIGRRSTTPVIVLGWTAPLWHERSLRKWASQRRDLGLKAFRPGSTTLQTLTNCRKAALDRLEHVVNDWRTETITNIVQSLQATNKDQGCGGGDSGIAISFPEMESRARCTLCLASTKFSVDAENANLAANVDTSVKIGQLKRQIRSCAEVEAVLAGYVVDIPVAEVFGMADG